MKRVALYVRVSTASKSRKGDAVAYDQDPAVQEASLRQLASQRGWDVHAVYSDRMSGSKERRPGPDRLMADAKRRQMKL
jgi:DNA invertase Pin-like site-specific DNA recombinase